MITTSGNGDPLSLSENTLFFCQYMYNEMFLFCFVFEALGAVKKKYHVWSLLTCNDRGVVTTVSKVWWLEPKGDSSVSNTFQDKLITTITIGKVTKGYEKLNKNRQRKNNQIHE